MDSERRFWSPRAQSSVIGVVLIIGLTLAAASAVVVFGSGAIDDGQQHSRVGQAEQAMTQLDSKTAQVALGDSGVQTIRMGQNTGTYRVNESAGHIKIYHENWNDSNTTYHREEIYESDLGSVVYQSGETTIAYQGGGVWRRDSGGGASMVSPPEVHYRRATLTMPIIKVRGTDANSGDSKATVRSINRGTLIFPDLGGETTPRSDQYGTSSNVFYENPVEVGNTTVEIQSDYCEAWRNYFIERTSGNVTDCTNDIVKARIVATGTRGNFDISGDNELTVRGVKNLTDFSIRMEQSELGDSTFNRLDWTMSTEKNDEEFGIHFEKGGGSVECGASMEGQVYYSNSSVDYTWSNSTGFPLDGPNCPGNDEPLYLEVDLLNTSIDMSGDTITINGTEYNSTNPPSLGLLVKYHFEEFKNMDMTIEEGNNAHMSDSSSGNIQYKGSGQVVTYLHLTENEVSIDFD